MLCWASVDHSTISAKALGPTVLWVGDVCDNSVGLIISEQCTSKLSSTALLFSCLRPLHQFTTLVTRIVKLFIQLSHALLPEMSGQNGLVCVDFVMVKKSTYHGIHQVVHCTCMHAHCLLHVGHSKPSRNSGFWHWPYLFCTV